MNRKLIIVLVFCAFPIIALSQTTSSTNSNQSTTTTLSSQSEDKVSSGENKNLREGIKSMAEGSNTLTTWCLTIIAASIITIVSTSYFRPLNKVRLIYLLFIPGWFFIFLSIYNGNKISRRFIAAMLTPRDDVLRDIGNKMNSEFSSQLLFLQVGLLFFSIWLLLYLLWWIFWDWSISTNTTKNGGTT